MLESRVYIQDGGHCIQDGGGVITRHMEDPSTRSQQDLNRNTHSSFRQFME